METWKPIKNYEERYEVSDLGRIRSLYYGNARKERKGKVAKYLVIRKMRDGRPYVTLCDGKTKGNKIISRLVAQVFIENENNHPNVCHKDNDPANNHISNLYWGTQQMNLNQMRRDERGRWLIGEKAGMAILTNKQVRVIKYALKLGVSFGKLGRIFGVHRGTIGSISCGKSWKHIVI